MQDLTDNARMLTISEVYTAMTYCHCQQIKEGWMLIFISSHEWIQNL